MKKHGGVDIVLCAYQEKERKKERKINLLSPNFQSSSFNPFWYFGIFKNYIKFLYFMEMLVTIFCSIYFLNKEYNL